MKRETSKPSGAAGRRPTGGSAERSTAAETVLGANAPCLASRNLLECLGILGNPKLSSL